MIETFLEFKERWTKDVLEFCEGGPVAWMSPDRWEDEKYDRVEFAEAHMVRKVRKYLDINDLSVSDFADMYQAFSRMEFWKVLIGSKEYWPAEDE